MLYQARENDYDSGFTPPLARSGGGLEVMIKDRPKPLSKQGLKSFLQVVIKPRERIARPMRSSFPHQRAETSNFIQCQQA